MDPLPGQASLTDQVYERLVDAVIAGTLPAGERIRQNELAERLGVSRQPVSHALQVLKRQGLLEETGRRGLVVSPIRPQRIRDIYQVRTALDALAARLAAEAVARGTAPAAARAALSEALERGAALPGDADRLALVNADVAFHEAIYRLAGNTAIEETVAAQWLHLKRSMAIVLGHSGERPKVWREHAAIAGAILAGDPAAAAAAQDHTERAAAETVRRLAPSQAA